MLSPHIDCERDFISGLRKVSKSTPHRLEPGIFHSMKAKREKKTLKKKSGG